MGTGTDSPVSTRTDLDRMLAALDAAEYWGRLAILPADIGEDVTAERRSLVAEHLLTGLGITEE